VRKIAATLLLLVLALAGCGGSVSTTHSLAKTRSCLEQKGATVGPPKGDFVASTASAGTFRAYLHGKQGNFVTLLFGADPVEAQTLAQGYDRFHGKNIGVADILFTDQNVTLLWKLHPDTADLDLVTGCLK
jgi:hypothetical protein